MYKIKAYVRVKVKENGKFFSNDKEVEITTKSLKVKNIINKIKDKFPNTLQVINLKRV